MAYTKTILITIFFLILALGMFLLLPIEGRKSSSALAQGVSCTRPTWRSPAGITGGIRVSWNPVANATSYTIALTSPSGQVTTIPGITATSYDFIFSSLSAGLNQVRVQAICGTVVGPLGTQMSFTVTVPLPNYRVPSIGLTTANLRVGQTIPIKGLIKNDSGVAASISTNASLEIWGPDNAYRQPLSGPPPDVGVPLVLSPQTQTGQLAAGASETELFSWTPTLPGSYRVRVIADAGTALAESNENDNRTDLYILVPVPSMCESLFVIGGDRGNTFNDIWALDTNGTWRNVVPLVSGSGTTEHSAAFYNNKIWTMGGFPGFAPLPSGLALVKNDLWSMDSSGSISQFDHDANLPGVQNAPWQAREQHVSLPYSNAIFLLGGETNGTAGPIPGGIPLFNDVWSFDGTNWTLKGTAPWAKRARFTAVSYQNKIWVMGGNDFVNFLNDVWSFNGSSWTPHGNASWIGRVNHASVVYNDKIWVIGGLDVSGNRKNDMWFFNGTGSWNRFDHDTITPGIQDAPWSKRERLTATTFNGKIWVMGGNDATGALNDVWSFDGTNWTPEATAPWVKRGGHTAVVGNFPCR